MVVERFSAWAAEADVQERIESVTEVAKLLIHADSGEDDRQAASKILTLCLDDDDCRVRAAIADVLANAIEAPNALIWSLAHDIGEVAFPIYRFSQQMCDSVLIAAIGQRGPMVDVAIAGRAGLTVAVVEKLISDAEPEAVLELLQNKSVRLGPVLTHDISLRHGGTAEIRNLLLERDDLESHTRQMLVASLGRELADLAGQNEWMSADRAQTIAHDSVNRSSVELAFSTGREELGTLVEHLINTGQMTPALLVRAICMGNHQLFERALAILSDTGLSKVSSIVEEGRASTFRALYRKTGLPENAYPVFAAAIEVWRDMVDEENGMVSEADLNGRAIEQIVERVTPQAFVDPSLINLLHRLRSEAARDCAYQDDQNLLFAA